ncbi:MAG: DUF4364 family protein [Clostridia bacterium]|nr:DUF4364 family protein [Clostridia bacterium]
MASAVGGMKNVKIFVLYLMQNLGRPLDFITLNDIVMQTDYIMYLDFAEAFGQMLDGDLIREVGELDGDKMYEITEKGICVAENLSSDVLSSILDKSLAAALRYLDFKKRGIEAKCTTERREDGVYEIHCQLLERGRVLFSNTLTVDSADRARRMAENFRDRPEVVYRGVLALLAGNMNFLFD